MQHFVILLSLGFFATGPWSVVMNLTNAYEVRDHESGPLILTDSKIVTLGFGLAVVNRFASVQTRMPSFD